MENIWLTIKLLRQRRLNQIEHVHVPPPQFKWRNYMDASTYGKGARHLYEYIPKDGTGIINIKVTDDADCEIDMYYDDATLVTKNCKSGFTFIGVCAGEYENQLSKVNYKYAIGIAKGYTYFTRGTKIGVPTLLYGPVKMEITSSTIVANNESHPHYSITFTEL